jgi:hypothetical protein
MICLRRVFVTEQKNVQKSVKLNICISFSFFGVGVGGGTLTCPMYCLVANVRITINESELL